MTSQIFGLGLVGHGLGLAGHVLDSITAIHTLNLAYSLILLKLPAAQHCS